MSKAIKPADEKTFAGTRDFGIAIRARIAERLGEGERAIVHLKGVEDMTPSFADECFGKLSEQHSQDIRELIELRNAEPFRQLIDAVVRMRLQRRSHRPTHSRT